MRRWLIVLLLTLASSALAQAPVVTPRGDPSVRNDTIYGLAVNPVDHPDEPYVVLFDDGIVRVEADGRGTRTYRQVIQVLKQDAAADFGEQVFSYSRRRERLTINWLRVVRPDGSVVSDSAAHEEETDAPTAMSDPVYSDTRIHRASLAGVAAGTLVDWSYTIETLQPVMPGDFFSSWSITNGRLTRRSRLILDVPASLTPRIRERNVRFARHVAEGHGRRVYTWATSEVPQPAETEALAVDSNDVASSIGITSPERWGDIARWYAGLARDRYEVTAALDSALSAVVSSQRTQADSVRALYSWVSREFRYVSVSLGIAGYQPRTPATILQSRYGDCKDKATLFIALAQRMGLHAYPVLLSSFGGVDSALVSVQAFDHAIVALERPGGYTYLDPTAESVPVGLLPPSETGSFALIVRADGRGEGVTLPRDSSAAQRTVLAGTLSTEGLFTGHQTETYTGVAQLEVRAALSSEFSATRRAQMARAMANAIFDGASGDSLQLFDGRDLGAEPRVDLLIRDGRASTRSGVTDILTLPMHPVVPPQLIAEVAAHVPRHYHISATRLFGTVEEVVEFRVTLPEGWHARLPPNVEAAGVFGAYTATYAQEGRELRVMRRTAGVRGVLPPERVTDLLAFLRAVGRDDARYIVLEHQ